MPSVSVSLTGIVQRIFFEKVVYCLKDCDWTTNKLTRALKCVPNLKCVLDCRSLKQLSRISVQKFCYDYTIVQTKKLQKRKSPCE